MTTLDRFKGPYASIAVAVYQPLILGWVSRREIQQLVDLLGWRAQKGALIDLAGAHTTAQAIRLPPRPRLPAEVPVHPAAPPTPTLLDSFGRPVTSAQVTAGSHEQAAGAVNLQMSTATSAGESLTTNGQPNATPRSLDLGLGVQSEGVAFPLGGLAAAAPVANPGRVGLSTVATSFNPRLGYVDPTFDVGAARQALGQLVHVVVTEWQQTPYSDRPDLAAKLREAFRAVQPPIYDFLPAATGVEIEASLSPLGFARYFRQLFVNDEEGVGPIEHAFTVAPKETLEIVYETVREQIHEEELEIGSETVSETAQEEKNTDEVSDKVSTMMQRDSSMSFSAGGSGGFLGLWSAQASTQMDFKSSSQKTTEHATHQVKEVTKRASERITKSTRIRTRDVVDVTTTNLTRHVIENTGDTPVSYGLRRVLRRVQVLVQDLGPRLVWQIYVNNPGAALAQSRFLMFRDAGAVTVPAIPPGAPPRPVGGTDTGKASCKPQYKQRNGGGGVWYVTLTVQPGPSRRVDHVVITDLIDSDGVGSDDTPPGPLDAPGFDETRSEDGTYTVNLPIFKGNAATVEVEYTYTYSPSAQSITDWETTVGEARSNYVQDAYQAAFDREKQLVVARSKVRPRPASDLRREETFEVMSRVVAYAFGRGDDPSEPSPVEIEAVDHLFEIEGTFLTTHPAWWRPRYNLNKGGMTARPPYEIAPDAEPAPFGSSLGWVIQVDGDQQRNEFLNSPWVRACLPIRPGREVEAVAWLVQHVEGDPGWTATEGGLLMQFLGALSERRQREDVLSRGAPDDIDWENAVRVPDLSALDGPPPEGRPLAPEDVYAIVDTFDVTVPTEGFIYDTILFSG